MLPLWDWPTAIALLIVGLVAGGVLVPLAYPMRLQENLALPVWIIALMLVGVPSAFFFCLSVLRHLTGLVPPFTTWAQWVVFALGASVGTAITSFEGRRG